MRCHILLSHMKRIPSNQDTPSIRPCRLDSRLPAADGLGWRVSFSCASLVISWFISSDPFVLGVWVSAVAVAAHQAVVVLVVLLVEVVRGN